MNTCDPRNDNPNPKKSLFSVGPFKKAYHRFISIRGNPREIALGFALGLFVGMSPYMMCHTVTAVFFASIFRWNKISAAAGVFITNPVTAPFFYRLTYLIGMQFFSDPPEFSIPDELTLQSALEILRSTPDLLWVLTVGGVATGIPVAIAGYYFAYWAITTCRKHK